MFDSKRDTLHFMVEVRATGWIGFGVETQAPTGMQGYDVAVGGVFNGSGYLQVDVFFKVLFYPLVFRLTFRGYDSLANFVFRVLAHVT